MDGIVVAEKRFQSPDNFLLPFGVGLQFVDSRDDAVNRGQLLTVDKQRAEARFSKTPPKWAPPLSVCIKALRAEVQQMRQVSRVDPVQTPLCQRPELSRSKIRGG